MSFYHQRGMLSGQMTIDTRFETTPEQRYRAALAMTAAAARTNSLKHLPDVLHMLGITRDNTRN